MTLVTIGAVQRTYGKNWCYLSHKRMGELLKEKHAITGDRTSQWRRTKFLRDQGLIECRQTMQRVEGFGVTWGANMYKITGKGWKLLHRLGYWFDWILSKARVAVLKHNTTLRVGKYTETAATFVKAASPWYTDPESYTLKGAITYAAWKKTHPTESLLWDSTPPRKTQGV